MLAKIRDIIIIGVLIYAAGALVPKAATALDSANVALDEVQELTETASESVQTFSEDARRSLDRINSLDFTGLNDAVNDLQESSENLKRATEVFGR